MDRLFLQNSRNAVRHPRLMISVSVLCWGLLLWSTFSYGQCFTPLVDGLDLDQFRQVGPTRVYNQASIFHYLNGEAEIYRSHGFGLLYSQTYRKPGTDPLIRADIYELGSPRSAKLLFDAYTGSGGSGAEGLGQRGWTDQSLVLFQRGAWLVRVLPEPVSETDALPSASEMIALARALDAALTE